jgi:general secretion pathway protein I
MITREYSLAETEGFTLVETVIAFLILSISMAVALQAVNIASQSINRARERDAVVDLVDRLRAEEMPIVLANGQSASRGRFAGMRWEIKLSPLEGRDRSEPFAGLATISIYPSASQTRHDDFIISTSSEGSRR